MIISIVFLCINGCGYNKSGNNEDFEKKENTITGDKDGALIKNEHVSEEKENTKEEDTDDSFEKEDIEGEKTWNDEYNSVLAREEYAESGRYMYIPTRQCTLHGGLVHGFRRYSARFPVNSALFRYLYPCSY